MERSDFWLKLLVLPWNVVSNLTIRLNQLCQFSIKIVVFFGRVEDKEHHLAFLTFRYVLENIIKMEAVDEAVSFGDSEDCFFEPHFVIGCDDSKFEIDCCDIAHEELAEFVDPVLGVGEEGPAELLLAAADDGEILAIVAEFFCEFINSFLKIMVIIPKLVHILLIRVEHGYRISLGFR